MSEATAPVNGDAEYVTDLVKKSGTSFFEGMRILPPHRRDAMYALYAFCRVVDDIADEEGPFEDKKAQLDAWRARIAALFAGQSFDPITRALAGPVKAFELRQQDFMAIIDGMEMDAGPPIVAPTLAELDLYCDRVAAAVGRVSVRIFGDASNAAEDVAYALGRALQLTNILRDVAEDAARGRLYLPYEYLCEAGIEPTPQDALASPKLPEVCARIAVLAEQSFSEAEGAMDLCDQRAMRPARLMAASYWPLLAIMRARKFNPSGPRVSLPKWRKLLLAVRLLLP